MNAKQLRTLTRLTVKPLLRPWVPFKLRRMLINCTRIIHTKIPDVERQFTTLDGIKTYSVKPADSAATKPTHILYLHGGGYVFGGLATHQQLVDSLALIGQVSVWMPEYRLAPEYPFPAALNDALNCYLTLLEQGIAAKNIVIAGDSAGGGLALALAVQLRTQHLPLPRALVLLSPWVDLTLQHASLQEKAHLDLMLSVAGLRHCAQAYLGTTAANHPLCSPLYADLSNLPPILIQVGSDEILLDDATALHSAVNNYGGDASLQVYDGLWHVFQLHAYAQPAATDAVQSLFAWLDAPR